MRALFGLGLLALFSFAPIQVLAAPTKATITRVEDGNPAKLKLAAGSKKGVVVGTQGHLVDSSGNKIKGSEFKVLSVEEKSCVVEVKMDSSKIDGSFGAILELP